MRDIYIISEDIMALNALEIILEINKLKNGGQYSFCGFLCDSPDWLIRAGLFEHYAGPLSGRKPEGSEVYAVGLVDPISKKEAVNALGKQGAIFETLVSPYALLPIGYPLGKGCVVTANTSISDGAIIKNYSSLLGGMIGPHAEVGEFSSIFSLSNITSAKIGNCVTVERNTAIMIDVTVGDYALIKAGSVVVRDVKEHAIVSGNPATKVRK